jgi:hypothetical protein
VTPKIALATSARRRRKRRSEDYRPPTTRRAARETAAKAGAEADGSPRPSRARQRHPDRPPSPWGSFPLVELVILLALVLLIVGFFVGQTRGVVMIAAGVSLGSLAALELTLREHLAGYRSHSSVLAGFVAVLVLGVGFFFAWPQEVKLGAGAAAFALGFYLFRELFKRRSGGLGFR